MTRSDILYSQTCEKIVSLSHQCKTENGIESDEVFRIKDVLGAFEQLVIVNQYGQEYTINPNQLQEL